MVWRPCGSKAGREASPAFGDRFDIVGPFQIGTREASWGADPLELYGGFQNLSVDDIATFLSSLGEGGKVGWSRHELHDHAVNVRHQESRVSGLVHFPDVSWRHFQSIYGWPALQWQAWARCTLTIPGAAAVTVKLYFKNVLEYYIDGKHYFGGDVYSYGNVPMVLEFNPGCHQLDLRIIYDGRSQGSHCPPNATFEIHMTYVEKDCNLKTSSMLVPELVDGRPAGRVGSITLTNVSASWVSVDAIRGMEIDSATGELKETTSLELLSNAFRLAPGQTRPCSFSIDVNADLCALTCVIIENRSQLSRSGRKEELRVPIEFHQKIAHESHRVTYQHPSGVVSYAILRPPSEDICSSSSAAKMPVLLFLHGAGVDVNEPMTRETFDAAPDLKAWVLCPSGTTTWSGDDWHTWGLADAEAAVESLTQWSKLVDWQYTAADTEKWLVTGHSNGGQGAWYVAIHRPDRVIGAAPVSGYSSIQAYVPYSQWTEVDPRAAMTRENALRSYRHELQLPNLAGIPILHQHGAADDNVPTFHGRRLKQLLSQQCQPDLDQYHEKAGEGHWWKGVMTTPDLIAFYKSVLLRPEFPPLPLTFSVIVANPADMGPKGTLLIMQLQDSEQLGRIDIERMSDNQRWTLETSNIRCFKFGQTQRALQLPKSLQVDGQCIDIPSYAIEYKMCFIRDTSGYWSVSKAYDGQRREQTGPLSSILSCKKRFEIRLDNESSMDLALQISRNLYQYYRADAEISILPQVHAGSGNIWIFQLDITIPEVCRACPLKLSAERGICFEKSDWTSRSFAIKAGMGFISLCPSPEGALDIVIWGVDSPGLRQAARLFPMLAGVGQPAFVVVTQDCAWAGIGSVLAMGSYDSHWRVSATSFIR